MYINDIVKARTLPSQKLARQRQRSVPLRVGTDVMKMAEQRTRDIHPTGATMATGKARQNKFKEPTKNLAYVAKVNDTTMKVGYHHDKETGITSLRASVLDSSGHVVQSEEIKGDMRITRNEDGSFSFLKGTDALTAGKLSGGDGDFLIRVSGADVTADKGEVGIINLGIGGRFDAGNAKVHYSGEYSNAVFSGGANGSLYGVRQREGDGDTTQASFINCTINAADCENTYGGYFANSTINGGEKRDIFSGIFASGNTLNGNGGSDEFTGYFMDSSLNGGGGHNTFAYNSNVGLNFSERFSDASMQFVNVTIDGGEGSRMNGVFDNAEITLGKGKNILTGVFANSTVTNDESQDTKIVALYANGTTFKGEKGSNTLQLLTGNQVDVALGGGDNKISIGIKDDSPVYGFLGHATDFSSIRFYDTAQQLAGGFLPSSGDPYQGTGYGTLIGVSVNVTEGSALLEVNTGLEQSIQQYGSNSASAEGVEGEVFIQAEDRKEKPAENTTEKSFQGPAEKTLEKTVEEERPLTSGTTSYYNYAGQKKRKSKGILSDTGIGDAVEVTSRYGNYRYAQEKNERLGHYKTIGLFRTTYDWQV